MVDESRTPGNPPDRASWVGRRQLLHSRAVAELRELAGTLHRRHRDTIQIFIALHDRSALLAEAHGILPIPVSGFVRELPGLAGWDAERAISAHVEAALAERRRRARSVADWLSTHAETAAASAAVRAITREIIRHMEDAPC
jgi:hypothetical protein